MSDALRTALMLARAALWDVLVRSGRGEFDIPEDMRRRVDMAEHAAADALELPEDDDDDDNEEGTT